MMTGPPPRVSDEEILKLVALSPDPIVTAGEIAEKVDMTQQAVNKRLRQLVEEGALNSRKVGSAAKVYWITEAGREEIAT